MTNNEISKTLKREIRAEFPNLRVSVRQTRNNGWVGQVIEVHVDSNIERQDLYSIYATARLFDDATVQVEVYNDLVVA